MNRLLINIFVIVMKSLIVKYFCNCDESVIDKYFCNCDEIGMGRKIRRIMCIVINCDGERENFSEIYGGAKSGNI